MDDGSIITNRVKEMCIIFVNMTYKIKIHII